MNTTDIVESLDEIDKSLKTLNKILYNILWLQFHTAPSKTKQALTEVIRELADEVDY